MSFIYLPPLGSLRGGTLGKPTRGSKKAAHWRQNCEERYFSFGDCCVRVLESRPPREASSWWENASLFFLHGRFTFAESWLSVVESMLPYSRCICVDFPGFGGSFSAWDRGLSLIEHVGLVQEVIRHFQRENERAFLIGHDIGGTIAQMCAAQGDPTIAGLVLINATCASRPVGGLLPSYFGWALKWRLKRLMRSAARFNAEHRRSLLEPWSNWSSRRALARALEAVAASWPDHYERLFWKKTLAHADLPVLLLWGARDQLNPPEQGEEMLRLFSDAELFQDEESSHWPLLENPSWVALKLREFVFRQVGHAELTRASS